MKNLVISIWIVMICSTTMALGFDFGKVGTSFVVEEEGFIEMMLRKLKEVNWKAENEKMKNIAIRRVQNPIAVAGIKPATENREFWHDPTYTLKEDVVLPCGKVLHKAGKAVNPLDYMDLERKLFFIDGREARQVEWLKQQLVPDSSNEENKPENRVILVGGSVFDLQEELGSEVYFDQAGELTTRFGIRGSPALAKQDGKLIRVEEFCLDEIDRK